MSSYELCSAECDRQRAESIATVQALERSGTRPRAVIEGLYAAVEDAYQQCQTRCVTQREAARERIEELKRLKERQLAWQEKQAELEAAAAKALADQQRIAGAPFDWGNLLDLLCVGFIIGMVITK